MALENRVETLEHDFKILKNEIQTILLEIQEQVLLHYYPELRGEDEVPSEVPGRRQRGSRPDGDVEEGEDDQDGISQKAAPTKGKAVKTREISLAEIKESEPQSKSNASDNQNHQKEQTDERTLLVNLLEWLFSSMEQIGTGTLRMILGYYADQGYLHPKLQESLMQFVGLKKEDDLEEINVKKTLDAFLRLDRILGRETDVADIFRLIEEAHLG